MNKIDKKENLFNNMKKVKCLLLCFFGKISQFGPGFFLFVHRVASVIGVDFRFDS